MTIEKRHLITLEEVIAFEFECKKCKVRTSIPANSKTSIGGACPHCGVPWLSLSSGTTGVVGKALEKFRQGVAEIVEHSEEMGCVFSVQIKEDKNAEGKPST